MISLEAGKSSQEQFWALLHTFVVFPLVLTCSLVVLSTVLVGQRWSGGVPLMLHECVGVRRNTFVAAESMPRTRMVMARMRKIVSGRGLVRSIVALFFGVVVIIDDALFCGSIVCFLLLFCCFFVGFLCVVVSVLRFLRGRSMFVVGFLRCRRSWCVWRFLFLW